MLSAEGSVAPFPCANLVTVFCHPLLFQESQRELDFGALKMCEKSAVCPFHDEVVEIEPHVFSAVSTKNLLERTRRFLFNNKCESRKIYRVLVRMRKTVTQLCWAQQEMWPVAWMSVDKDGMWQTFQKITSVSVLCTSLHTRRQQQKAMSRRHVHMQLWNFCFAAWNVLPETLRAALNPSHLWCISNYQEEMSKFSFAEFVENTTKWLSIKQMNPSAARFNHLTDHFISHTQVVHSDIQWTLKIARTGKHRQSWTTPMAKLPISLWFGFETFKCFRIYDPHEEELEWIIGKRTFNGSTVLWQFVLKLRAQVSRLVFGRKASRSGYISWIFLHFSIICSHLSNFWKSSPVSKVKVTEQIEQGKKCERERENLLVLTSPSQSLVIRKERKSTLCFRQICASFLWLTSGRLHVQSMHEFSQALLTLPTCALEVFEILRSLLCTGKVTWNWVV